MIEKALKKNIKWIVIFICVIILLAIIEDLFEKEAVELDLIVYKLVVLNLRTDTLTFIMKIITNLGGAYVLIGIGIISLLVLKNKRIGILINSNLIITAFLNYILKNIIQRPRPEGYRLISETGYSFPSGHSMASMAFYGLIIYLIWKTVKNKKIKYISCTLLGILIPLIGFSRIYLGVHYASDVIGGFAVSMVYLILVTGFIKSFLQLKQENKEFVEGEEQKMQSKRKKLKNSFKYAFAGIFTALKKEQNMKIHFIISILVILAGIILKINTTEWIICLMLIGIVISLELVNTSIEQVVDIAMPEINEKAKIAKDVAAGAVLVVAIISAVIGLIIFIPKNI